jgi:hypothetical protein
MRWGDNAAYQLSELGAGSSLGDEFSRGYARGPERALLAALLFDGVQLYLQYVHATTAAQKSRYREAETWITLHDSEYVFSFDNCCEALGINPETFRAGLLAAYSAPREDWKRARRKF